MYLVFDFDGTITQKDTISQLAQAALEFHKNQRGTDLTARWSQAVQAYMDDYQAYRANHPTPDAERQSVLQELSYLAGLRNIEEASLARVEVTGVFSGLERTDLLQMGVEAVQRGDIVIRNGFKEIIALAEQRGWGVGIVSVNWSRAFIEGVLRPYNGIRIISNEISRNGKIEGPTFLGGQLTTSSDKNRALSHMIHENTDKVVYFGDSVTDMECLLRGGIVFATDEASSLQQTLRRVGIQVPHVANLQSGTDIAWARDFEEVLQSGMLDG